MRTSALERLNIVWDPRRHAFERCLAHAAAYAATHGHLAAPVDVQHDGFALGRWLATQRKRAEQLTSERTQALHDLDPHWNPAWPLTWQRAYHAARHHSETDQPLGEVARTYLTDNGLRLGEWLHTQRTKLPAHPGQQELLTHLGLTSEGVLLSNLVADFPLVRNGVRGFAEGSVRHGCRGCGGIGCRR